MVEFAQYYRTISGTACWRLEAANRLFRMRYLAACGAGAAGLCYAHDTYMVTDHVLAAGYSPDDKEWVIDENGTIASDIVV